jgi:hypothetical protein
MLCSRVTLSQDRISDFVAVDLPKPPTKECLQAIVHFLAEASSPELVFFDNLRISGNFPLELLTEVCLRKRGIFWQGPNASPPLSSSTTLEDNRHKRKDTEEGVSVQLLADILFYSSPHLHMQL